jgi:hypothetical protein
MSVMVNTKEILEQAGIRSSVKKEEPKIVEKTIIQKADTTKIEAVTKIAYDKASTALDVANNQADLIKQLTKAVKTLQPNKSFCLKINRDKNGFISTIDVDCK